MTKITFNFLSVLKERGALYTLLFFVGMSAFSQELITNGDIESSGGWRILQYSNVAPSGTSQPKQYAVVTNSQQFNGAFVNSTSRTGSGNFLAFDMLTGGGQQHFWQMGTNGGGICALNTKVTHTFSYWVRTLSNGSRPEIDVMFNNASNVVLVSGSKTTPDVSAGWQQVVYTFTPTNNCVNITFRHTNSNNLPDGSGNDFALDDFSLTAPPPALSIEYYSNAASCPNNSDASIEAYRFGGTGPYTYNLTGTTAQTNATGIFTGLPAGSYTVTVTDNVGGSATTPSINLEAPIDITTSPNVSICAGDSTTLTVSGSTSTYNWVANPADASITNPASASQNVTPNQTTTYTVSSTVVTNASITTNLLSNADFSAGNSGFTSDYEFLDGTNPTKKQKAYGIVSNPKAWEEDFTTCGDRTSSNNDGLMMVVDGAITALNNDRVWSQTVNALKTNTNYIFSYWIQSVASLNPASLETQINGVVVGTDTAPAQSCGWIRKFYRWNSGASTTATISIIDRNVILAGNDFALDEMSFAEAVLCDLSKQVTVTVNPKVTAAFSFDTSYNVGDVPVALPTTSDNGITGTWNPATISTASVSNTNYTFTPNNPSQCATGAVNVLVSVINNVQINPTFTLPASICRGTIVTLPLVSDNGITGTWNPAIVDNTQSGSYLFTPTVGQNANDFPYNLTVNQPADLTFPNIRSTYCIGDAPDALPNPNGGYTGTWAAASISTASAGTVNYVFTPTAGQCVNPFTLPVTVNAPIVPTFNGMPSNAACQNQMVGALPTVSAEGITGSWSPAIDTSVAGLTNYTFTPDAGQCASSASFGLTVNAPIVPTFNGMPSNTACQNQAVGALPTVSAEGITGTWSPAIDTNVVGLTTYTFTPDAGQCATTASFGITVTVPTIPTFNNLPSNTVCQNEAAGSLPFVSAEGITGTWSPAVDTSVVGNNLYTFTPDAGQCASTSTFTLTVTPLNPITFNGMPNTVVCQSDVVNAFPNTSTEGVTGTWSPSLDLNLIGTTTYTFTPNPGQCAQGASFVLTVNGLLPPTFDSLSRSVCQGDTSYSLPTSSENGIIGTWAPSFDVNTPSSQSYTFTPNAGQCASSTSVTITINQRLTPSFAGLSTSVCQGDITFSLPTTSENGVTGTWSPAFDVNTPSVTMYTFTPTAGLCADPTSVTITINQREIPSFAGLLANVCQGDSTFTLPLSSDNNISGTWSPTLDVNTPSSQVYTFTPIAGLCAATYTFTLNVNARVGTINIEDNCVNTDYVLSALPVSGSFDTSAVTYTWTNANGVTVGDNTANLNVTKVPGTIFPADFTVTVNNASGCPNTQTFNVKSIFCEIPKGVSPNGDGANDTFDLTRLNPNKVEIFNRYGVKIFEQANYTNQWFGQTNDGDELPAATYYYVAEMKDGEVKSGWVYLSR